jgi:hypothetical protein
MDGVSSLTDPRLDHEQVRIVSLQEALRLNLQHRKATAREKRSKPKKEAEKRAPDTPASEGAREELSNLFL